MKDERLYELLTEGMVETSETFTGDIMQKIEQKPVSVGIPRQTQLILLVLLLVLILLPILGQLLIPGITSIGLVFIPLILFTMFALNRLLVLRVSVQP